MKKKIIVKIILDVIILLLIAFSIYYAIGAIKNISHFHNNLSSETEIAYKRLIFSYAKMLIYYISVVIFSIFVFIIINFTDLSFFAISISKSVKEHRTKTSESRKQKRIERLENELNDLKKDE